MAITIIIKNNYIFYIYLVYEIKSELVVDEIGLLLVNHSISVGAGRRSRPMSVSR